MTTQVRAVVTKDHNGALRSALFASRPQIVRINPLQHDTGLAVQAVVLDVGAGDFLVRSVRAGRRRKIEILAGQVPVEMARLIDGFVESDDDLTSEPRRTYTAGDCIQLTAGDTVAGFPQAVCVAD